MPSTTTTFAADLADMIDQAQASGIPPETIEQILQAYAQDMREEAEGNH